MDSPYLFISYSRIQFYFVEALAHALATLKVPYWFDVEQLEMGTDWQAGIDNGLANCQALVLVASRASIGSPNVRYEWETAQKANKPIFLALFEAVDLPPELRGLPVIDFRGNFRASGISSNFSNRSKQDRLPPGWLIRRLRARIASICQPGCRPVCSSCS